ncbi:TetR-like C-terminal domain-containing protein [Marinitenerispora sediminis]|uniref:TetR-like C-terminal domain-containing protein n=1 Tax=Marinitenerispora sediminis TaxID=1931232 RepID=UPI0021639276|nr:TetR-like C-terminal domain-containing protein [Marinitenerispora sediminis]
MEYREKHQFRFRIRPPAAAQRGGCPVRPGNSGVPEGHRRGTPPGAMVVMLSCWRSVYGQVAMEVFAHFAPLVSDQEPMFELLMRELVRGMGIESQ